MVADLKLKPIFNHIIEKRTSRPIMAIGLERRISIFPQAESWADLKPWKRRVEPSLLRVYFQGRDKRQLFSVCIV
jgi:hypothetical protein